jgi:ABC-type amino acid transport substrate-binding protein
MKRNLWRKGLALCGLLILIVSFTLSCSSGSGGGGTQATGNDLLARIIKNGKIVATLNVGNPPWSYQEGEKFVGMGVDLIEGWAKGIGVTVEYMPLEFQGLIPAIESGKADIITMNLSMTVPRSARVMYTDSVGKGAGVAVIIKGRYTNFDEINKAGVTIGTETGTIHETVGEEVFPNASMQTVPGTADGFAALKAGRIVAMLTDDSVGLLMTSQDSNLEMMKQYTYTDTLAFAVKMGTDSYTFLQSFNTYMKLIKINGTYADIYKKYYDAEWVPTAVSNSM